MGTAVRVTIQIDSLVIVPDGDAAGVAEQVESAVSQGSVDPDVVLWLLGAAETVRAKVSAP